MFDKILIANRGEIACRVMKTAQKMGIQTVALFSDADKNTLHVQMADEAVHIGPAPASESYLVTANILKAINETGAQAVHPGYGFLSENAAFVDALSQSETTFIGPNKSAIEVMGDKIQSKKFADEAGVNTVPGFLGVIEDEDEAVKIADDIGYPVMIKASAGGGGKGMRIAHSADQVREGWAAARSEAKSSFGDDRVFIEKFIVNPRHIEIQVLGDKHGNCIHLAERECSIQRRNQKVIEEAPSSFLDEVTRSEMGEQAVALAKAVNYDSAGTVEFIVDQDKNFYFLEMNTRLQVEHPVTELITGIDLVEQMIRVASGEPLSISQDDIEINGWAIESRIYAEDPYRNFLPSIGRLKHYRPPAEGQQDGITLRNDTGVQEGSEISMFYDPMIAKLCTHGPDRSSAIEHMGHALNKFQIAGIEHNIPFLSALMKHPRWQSGNISTAFIEEEYPEGFQGAPLDDVAKNVFICAATVMTLIYSDRLDRLEDRMRPHSGTLRREWIAIIGDDHIPVSFDQGYVGLPFEGDILIGEERETHKINTSWLPGDTLFSCTINDKPYDVSVLKGKDGYQFIMDGQMEKIDIQPPYIAQLKPLMPEKQVADTSKFLMCPMPGLIKDLQVEIGQEIKSGDTLAIVEAMKMENILRAERDSVVKAIHAQQGDSLQVDDIIIEFE